MTQNTTEDHRLHYDAFLFAGSFLQHMDLAQVLTPQNY